MDNYSHRQLERWLLETIIPGDGVKLISRIREVHTAGPFSRALLGGEWTADGESYAIYGVYGEYYVHRCTPEQREAMHFAEGELFCGSLSGTYFKFDTAMPPVTIHELHGIVTEGLFIPGSIKGSMKFTCGGKIEGEFLLILMHPWQDQVNIRAKGFSGRLAGDNSIRIEIDAVPRHQPQMQTYGTALFFWIGLTVGEVETGENTYLLGHPAPLFVTGRH